MQIQSPEGVWPNCYGPTQVPYASFPWWASSGWTVTWFFGLLQKASGKNGSVGSQTQRRTDHLTLILPNDTLRGCQEQRGPKTTVLGPESNLQQACSQVVFRRLQNKAASLLEARRVGGHIGMSLFLRQVAWSLAFITITLYGSLGPLLMLLLGQTKMPYSKTDLRSVLPTQTSYSSLGISVYSSSLEPGIGRSPENLLPGDARIRTWK